MNTGFVKYSLSNVRNKLAEKLYINSGLDITRPIQIYGIVNYKCNARCPMCNDWRRPSSVELPASVWIRALQSLKRTSGTFHINFSGGEPLLKTDFLDILEFCSRENIMAGFTTNGLLLNKVNTDRILGLNIANVNISLDSMEEGIHDAMRGVKGIFNKVMKNIEYLISEKIRLKNNIQIILKPTVCSLNIQDIDKIVLYAKEANLTGVNFQPIAKWTKEAEDMFSINNQVLSDTIRKLADLKKKHFNILNSIQSLNDWHLHFNEVIPAMNSPCSVPLRNLYILPDGNVFMCLLENSKLGNIEADDIGLLWKSERAKKLRKALVRCKRVCTESCVVKRSLKDYIEIFFMFLKR